MSRNKRPLTQAEFIGRFALETGTTISKGQVSKDVSAGMPLTSFEDAMAWRATNKDHSRPKAKEAVRAASQPLPVSRQARSGEPPASSGGSASDGTTPDMNKARAWDIHFSAENRKRAMLKHDREHIALAEVEAAWDAANTMYRQGLEGVAGRTASVIAAMTGGDAARIEGIIRDEHRTALAAVADLFDKAALLAEAEAGADETAIIDADLSEPAAPSP